jgi:hypothetical protein
LGCDGANRQFRAISRALPSGALRAALRRRALTLCRRDPQLRRGSALVASLAIVAAFPWLSIGFLR